MDVIINPEFIGVHIIFSEKSSQERAGDYSFIVTSMFISIVFTEPKGRRVTNSVRSRVVKDMEIAEANI